MLPKVPLLRIFTRSYVEYVGMGVGGSVSTLRLFQILSPDVWRFFNVAHVDYERGGGEVQSRLRYFMDPMEHV